MNKRERDEHFSRNFWDQIHGDNLLMLIRNGRAGLWNVDLMDAHRHLVWHFAHEENERLNRASERRARCKTARNAPPAEATS
ncbi:hypothetical protein [Bradyrhizobium elkanii]|uniref:hypothetical protein n=1 Tax=Bradyrhizobium elkanii TaxID=29448 RepID=UPI0008421713|nr:hypothetical protein [Bradyrhizobium elkanii]ODM71728.1 hypothetical protein A6X20_07240 [Bradyrhizobium elkanii]ODM79101.1 hypothetical protein A6452_28825 [Bradyrhizobium elkanii]